MKRKVKFNLLIGDLEKEAFRKKQKLHYKNEYKNAKILLK
jgi:hypothetical protein